MTLTPEQARQLSADFSAALARETNEEIRRNGMPLVNLFAEAARTEDDEERQGILERMLAYNYRMYERAKRVHSTREDLL